MAESWSEFLAVLAAMSVYIMGECHPLEVDGPARLSDSPESLRTWIDELSVHLINLLRDGATNESSVKCSGVPQFSLFTCILELDRKDLRDMTAGDTTHSECTDDHCKEFEKSDLEKAGKKPLKKKKKRKVDKTLMVNVFFKS